MVKMRLTCFEREPYRAACAVLTRNNRPSGARCWGPRPGDNLLKLVSRYVGRWTIRTLPMTRPPAEDFEVVALDEDHVKGVAFNIAFMVWRYRTLVGPYRAGIQLVTELALKHPTGVGVMHVVETEAVPPDSDTRRAIAEILQLPTIKHFSVTHEGTGFKAASVRAIVSGGHALARPSFEYAVHSTVAEASRWAAVQNKRIGRQDDWQAIERVLQALRRLHVEKYPRPQL